MAPTSLPVISGDKDQLLQQALGRLAASPKPGGPDADAIVTATLICGGVLEKCPDLKVCIAHGGGPACFAMGRLDRTWHERPQTRSTLQPPSAYETVECSGPKALTQRSCAWR